MIGAIAGDVIGSIYEGASTKSTDFQLFFPYSTYTDDSVMTLAIADAILNDRDYAESMRDWGRRYPKAGYGGRFYGWLFSENPEPYESWGNGSAMKICPVGYAFDDEKKVLSEAEKVASFTHNHPEGIAGAQSVALSVFMARNGSSKEEIKREISKRFDYDLDRTVEAIRPDYSFEVRCKISVPESMISFLDSDDTESAIRLAISLGGDSDTQACIAGGIAQAFYKDLPENIVFEVKRRLKPDMLKILEQFESKFQPSQVS